MRDVPPHSQEEARLKPEHLCRSRWAGKVERDSDTWELTWEVPEAGFCEERHGAETHGAILCCLCKGWSPVRAVQILLILFVCLNGRVGRVSRISSFNS